MPVFSQAPPPVPDYRSLHNLPTYQGLLPATGTEPTLFRNSPPKVAGLQVHAITPRFFYYLLYQLVNKCSKLLTNALIQCAEECSAESLNTFSQKYGTLS